LKDFAHPLSQRLLNIEEKNRSNLFAWRGQFSPQLIECLLDAYCPDNSVVLDPFVGSGTVLFEATAKSLPAFGFEINPSAWSFSKLYEFASVAPEAREHSISELREELETEFPIVILSEEELAPEEVEVRITRIGRVISEKAKILCNALVVLLDLFNNRISCDLVQSKFAALARLVRDLPFTPCTIKADLRDARNLPLDNQSVDFVVTSPPYINVFNYHQNYRRSVELLGWNSLLVARSEIGSNRANRGNRFYTVVQYCIDMASTLQELARVLRPGGRIVLIVGYESQVLGTPFYNADLAERLAGHLGIFDIVLRQERTFTNRFGKCIREVILNLERVGYSNGHDLAPQAGREVAGQALMHASARAPEKSKALLAHAVERVPQIGGTPVFNGTAYSDYQTRKHVMMVKERNEPQMTDKPPPLPTPHLAKLKALTRNARLPKEDKPQITKALKRYEQWIKELAAVKPGSTGAVKKLVDATNKYKKFIELDLIFDSKKDFLYRQKGQLKLDNTILEEFLPQLLYRGLSLPQGRFEYGPRKTFAGLSFTSTISSASTGAQARLRTKDQDFVLGKKLFMRTSFDKDFSESENLESHLGYVCAECKTNLDKTMFQEAVATSRDLKIAVPSSLYFLVCEFLDMTPVSITPTHIDDVLIVRKAKRMSSNVRQEYKTAKDRRSHRDEYVKFLNASKYYTDVFQRMIDRIQSVVDDADPAPDKVVKRGHF